MGPVLQPTFTMSDMDLAHHEQSEQAARTAGMCAIFPWVITSACSCVKRGSDFGVLKRPLLENSVKRH